MDYMRQNCARTCGFCIVNDLIDYKTDNKAETFSNLNRLKKPANNVLTNGLQSHRFIESWFFFF